MDKHTYTVKIEYDQDAASPREWDNIGLMVFNHKRHSFPNDVNVNFDEFSSWDEVKKYLIKEHNAIHILPVQMYEHSGIRIYVGTSHDQWDGGQLGFIFTTKEQLKKTGEENYTPKMIKAILTGEVDVYSKYVDGECYAYTVEDESGNVIDSCAGFFDRDEAEKAGNEFKALLEKDQDKLHEKNLKAKIKNKVPLSKR